MDKPNDRRTCPYDSFPPSSWWSPSVAALPAAQVEPIGAVPFTIRPTDRIATAGSCFAQEIGRSITNSGFTFLDAEPAPACLTTEERRRWQFGLFSARYGNVYTSTQLLQLAQRALGLFVSVENHWLDGRNGFIDPFRPSVSPGGASSLEELLWDRDQHLSCVKRMIEQLDVMVFTLGLTEGWRSRVDGSVFPTCPGCGHGTFDPDRYESFNMTVRGVLEDLEAFHALLKSINRQARMVLTVSPVPLVATLSGQHVLAATHYSKAVLRAAAGEFSSDKEDVCYFPAYEIIMGQYARGTYFSPNLRTVTREGVAHVMRCFFKMFAGAAPAEASPPAGADRVPPIQVDVDDALSIICDEEELQQRYEESRG